MDAQTLIWIIDGLLVVVCTGLGWFARQLWDAVKELKADLGTLKDDLSHLEVKLAKEYVAYDRLKDALEPIMSALVDIKETLKTKADK